MVQTKSQKAEIDTQAAAFVLSEATARPWGWHWATQGKGADQTADGRIYSPGFNHTYCVAVSPRYQTKRKWEADAALIVRAVNNHDALVKAHEENIRLLSLVAHDLQGRVEGSKLSAIDRCIERSRAAFNSVAEAS